MSTGCGDAPQKELMVKPSEIRSEVVMDDLTSVRASAAPKSHDVNQGVDAALNSQIPMKNRLIGSSNLLPSDLTEYEIVILIVSSKSPALKRLRERYIPKEIHLLFPRALSN